MSSIDVGRIRISTSKKRQSGRIIRIKGRLLALSLHGLCLAAAVLAPGSAFVGAAGPGRGGALRRLGRVGRRQGPGPRVSSFQGVSWHARGGKWQVHLPDPASGTNLSVGMFDSEIDAAEAFDQASLAILGPAVATNFPADQYMEAELQSIKDRITSYWEPRPSDKYNGVYRTRGSTKWKAEITLMRKQRFIDDFDTEEDAARAYDQAVRRSHLSRANRLKILNFRQQDDYFSEETWADEPLPKGAKGSAFIGVMYHVPSRKYKAKVRRRILGLFEDEREAARAVDEASLARGGATNFPPPPAITDEGA